MGSPPYIRVDGHLEAVPVESCSASELERIVDELVPDDRKGDLLEHGQVDFAHSVAGLGRFRVNLHRQRGSFGLVVRRVQPGMPSLGWATPTEAGALGAFVVYVAALLNRMKWGQLNEALIETAKLTVMIFAIIWGILIFVRFLGFAGVPERFSEWVVSLPVAPVLIIIGILFVYLVLGCFMDAIGMLLLTLPIVYPAVIKLGYDPICHALLNARVRVMVARVCDLFDHGLGKRIRGTHHCPPEGGSR